MAYPGGFAQFRPSFARVGIVQNRLMCASPRSGWCSSGGGSRRADDTQGAQRIAYHRFGYCRRRGFLALKFNRRTNVEPCTNVQSKLFSPAFGNTLLAVRASFVSFFLVLFVFHIIHIKSVCLTVVFNFKQFKTLLFIEFVRNL